MEKNEKEYPVSDDIALLYDKATAATELRDIAMKLPFGYKKALRASTDSIRLRALFWSKIYEVYPELQKERLIYNPITKTVKINY